MASFKERNVFISYKQDETEDTLCVHLEDALKKATMSPFLGKDLSMGEEFASTIMDALEKAQVFVIVASPKFFSSKWCVMELHMAIEMHKGGRAKILPVFYDMEPNQCKLEESELKAWRGSWLNEAPESVKRFTKIQGIQRTAYGKDNRSLIKAIVKEVAGLLDIKLALKEEKVNNLPDYHIDHFIGREDEMKEISLDLKRNHVCVIQGMSGLGKSQLALEYGLDKEYKEYNRLLWVSGGKKGTLRANFAALAKILKVDIPPDTKPEEREEKSIDIVKQELQDCKEHTLLVLDDVESWGDVKDILPNKPCHVIITTRKMGLSNGRPTLVLSQLGPEDSLTLARGSETFQGEQLEALKDVCKMVDSHTLALTIISALMSSGCLPSTLRTRLMRSSSFGFVEGESEIPFKKDSKVPILFKEAFDALKRSRADTPVKDRACQLALVGGWFSSAPIRKSLLQAAVLVLVDEKESSRDIDDRAIELLVRFHLAQRDKTETQGDKEDPSLKFHSMIQMYERQQDGAEEAGQAVVASLAVPPADVRKDTDHFLAAFEWVLPGQNTVDPLQLDPKSKVDAIEKVYLPLAMELGYEKYQFEQGLRLTERCLSALSELQQVNFSSTPPLKTIQAKGLGTKASILEQQGQYDEADPLYRTSLEIVRAALGQTHPSYGTTLHNLAGLLEKQGKYEEAKPLFSESLEVVRAALGEKHPSYSAALHASAGFLEKQGRYDEAELLYSQALEIYWEALGKKHPSSCGATLHALTEPLEKEGKGWKAKPLYRESLEIKKAALCETHPQYGAALQGLARLLEKQGKYEEAEPLYRQALEIKRAALGERHPQYGAAMEGLARLLEEQGKYEDAEPLYRQALEIMRAALSETHPQYGAALQGLARLFEKQGKYEEAESLYRELLEIYKAALGEKHPEYGATLHILAGLLRKWGKYDEAKSLYTKSLEIKRAALGEKHPEYSVTKKCHSYEKTLCDLAELLDEHSKYEEAEPLYRESLKMRERRKFCGGYRWGLDAQMALAEVLEKQGKYDEAEPLYVKSLYINRPTLGIDRMTDDGATLRNLAGLLVKQGKYELAEPLYRESLAILGKEDHPSYGATLHHLAGVLEEQGKYEEAEEKYRESLKRKGKFVGEKHLEYGVTLHNLAGLLEKQGKYDEAKPLYMKSLEVVNAAVGLAHPDYGVGLHNLAGVLEKQGKHKKAEPLYRESLEIKRAALGKKHPSYGATLHNLAGVLEKQGKHMEAETKYRESLEIKRAALGETHPSYGAALHALVRLLKKQGKFEEAEEKCRESLEVVRALGKNHPSNGTTLHNLAGLLVELGKYEEAEPLYRESLEIKRAALGEKHQKSWYSRTNALVEKCLSYRGTLGNLAGLLEKQGKYDEAEPLYRESLEVVMADRICGATRHALAGLLEKQGKHDEAELYRESVEEHELSSWRPMMTPTLDKVAGLFVKHGEYKEAKRLYRESLETTHPSDLEYGVTLGNLAWLLKKQGKDNKAKPLYRKFQEVVRAAALGKDDRDARILDKLAGLLEKQGNYDEAKPLYTKSLEIKRAYCGKDPTIRNRLSCGSTMHALAGLLEEQGKYEEAEPLYRQSLEIYRAYRVKWNHLGCGASLHALVRLLKKQGKYDEAELLYRESLEIKRAALGEKHPSYGVTLHTLAGLLEEQGKYDEAEPLYRESLEIKRAALGEKHPSYDVTLHTLAGLLGKQGKYDEAEPMYRQALEIRRAALGEKHLSYGASLHALAGLLEEQGKYDEVEPLYRESLEIKRAALGAKHPSYGVTLHALVGLLEKQGKSDEAEWLYRQALEIKRAALGGAPELRRDPACSGGAPREQEKNGCFVM